jgi:hypothetical protein
MTQYLILHKVRGLPQFDVAEPARIGEEDGWVLCTCGHRAFPLWSEPIDHFVEYENNRVYKAIESCLIEGFDDWPDHYTPKPEAKIKLNIPELVWGMLPKIKRRI